MVEELKVLKCPSCGANAELDENQDFGFCKYCGSKIERAKPAVQKVEITNPVQIEGKVQVVNNEFESKLVYVKCLEKDFFLNPSVFNYNQVIEAYEKLKENNSNESKLWQEFARFIVNANLNKQCTSFENIYQLNKKYLELALDISKDEHEKEEIELLQQDNIKKLSQIREKTIQIGEKYRKQRIKIIIIGIIVWISFIGILISKW